MKDLFERIDRALDGPILAAFALALLAAAALSHFLDRKGGRR